MSANADSGSAGTPAALDEATGPRVLVVMGVSGCGKSTVAALLAGRRGWAFEEGDGLHPQANVDKMHAGQPLTDEDRWPWLAKVADWIDGQLDAGLNGIITCSALKRSYRDILNRRGRGVVFVFLAGTRETIAARLTARHGHFMPRSLLDSQFEALEEPQPDEPAVRIDIGPAPAVIVDEIVHVLNLDAEEMKKRHEQIR
jgi:carbohydrate kinase (thermoresistant glucokinase family)